MTTMTPHALQVVGPESTISTCLSEWLEPDVAIKASDAKPERGSSPILIDADAFDIPPDHMSQWASVLEPVISPTADPCPKVVWVSDKPWEDWIHLLHHYHIGRVLPRKLLSPEADNAHSVKSLIHSLWEPQAGIGLKAHLGALANSQTVQMANSNDIGKTFDLLRQFFELHQAEDIVDLSTVLMEALTNAVYHAPRDKAGAKKYQKGQRIDALLPNEIVTVEYGWNGDVMGISIRDQWGSVHIRDLLFWLSRNVSGEGLLDTSGRGIYLMHTLVDRCVVNLHPGEMTEILIIKRPVSKPDTPKLLWINTP